MRVFLLKDEDFENLLANLDRDARYGRAGGSSQVFSEKEAEALKKAHSFYNYQVRTWIDSVKS